MSLCLWQELGRFSYDWMYSRRMIEGQLGRGPPTKLVTFDNALALVNEISAQHVEPAMRRGFKSIFEELVAGNMRNVKWIEVQKWSVKSVLSGAMSPRIAPADPPARLPVRLPVLERADPPVGPGAGKEDARVEKTDEPAADQEVEPVGVSGNVFRVVPRPSAEGKDRCSWSAVQQESIGSSIRTVGVGKFAMVLGREKEGLPVYSTPNYGLVVRCTRLIEVSCGLHGTDASRVSSEIVLRFWFVIVLRF